MTVPLVDLRAEYAAIRDELQPAVAQVFETGMYVLGPGVAGFEEAFAAYCGAEAAIGVNSGTDALQLALEQIREERGPGRVVTTPFTFFATAESILQAGLEVVFADIEPETFNLDPAAVAAAAGPETVAVLPVHLFGACADVDAMRVEGAVILEDAAQAVGAEYKGRRAGSLADLAAFSFYPTKNLAAAGDAGMITSVAARAEGLRLLRAHGEARSEDGRSYHYLSLGHNSRLDALQAAVLSVKLRHLDAWQDRRARNAAYYEEAFADVGGVRTPGAGRFGRHVYHQYAIRAERRDALRVHLVEQGIGCNVFYPLPLHLQPALEHLGYKAGAFPESERASKEVLSLPVHPWLEESQLERVAAAVSDFYGT